MSTCVYQASRAVPDEESKFAPAEHHAPTLASFGDRLM
jgi:hypothetical protein